MENILRNLESGTSDEKIKILENLDDEDNPELLQKIISKLDDDDVRVRGEAFSSLLLNENKISDFLIENLKSVKKNIRGFTSLVLANRNEESAIPEIIKLVKDESSMVRSCAIGALGHLKVKDSNEIILQSLSDSNLEVKKSVLQAMINLNIKISENEIKEIVKEKDDEIEKLLMKLKMSGPEGIWTLDPMHAMHLSYQTRRPAHIRILIV